MVILRWCAMNGLLLTMLGLGVSGTAGAMSVFTFAIWVWFAMVLIVTLAGKKIPVPKSKRVPRWLDVGYDILVIGILAWFGHAFLATLYLITMCGQSMLVVTPEETAV